jgi:hypothetical protein
MIYTIYEDIIFNVRLYYWCHLKTAVIFTGFLRTFNYTKHSFEEFILNPLDPDIFISTPNTFFTKKQDEEPNWVERHPFHYVNENIVDEKVLGFFRDHLKSYEVRDYDHKVYKDICNKHNVPEFNFHQSYCWRVASYLFSIQKSVCLFKQYVEKHNLVYDLVIMTRGDNKYFTTFNPNVLDLNKISYPDHNRNQKGYHYLAPHLPPSDRIPKTFSDQLLVGNQNNMLIWSNIGDKSFEYFNEGMYYTAENLMPYHLMKNNIDWYGSNYIEHALWRLEED